MPCSNSPRTAALSQIKSLLGKLPAAELRAAYDRVHGDYDGFWLVAAAKPVDDLIQKMNWRGNETVFEAGCGTGYATAQLARTCIPVVPRASSNTDARM